MAGKKVEFKKDGVIEEIEVSDDTYALCEVLREVARAINKNGS